MAPPDYPVWSQRKASLIGGIALLLLAVLAGLANFGVVEVLVTPGDAARTAADLIESEGLFRSGIAGLLVVVILDIVVACSLLAVFESVNRSVAIMAAVFRIAYSTVFLVAISQLVSTLTLLDDANSALRAVGQFHTIWDASYTLFVRAPRAHRLPGVPLGFRTKNHRRPARLGWARIPHRQNWRRAGVRLLTRDFPVQLRRRG